MPIAICPIAQNEGRCRDQRCRLRHDVVQCEPCRRYVLHEGLARHRRGEEHRRNCDFTESRAPGTSPSPSPAYIIRPQPLPHPRVRKSAPQIPVRKKSMKAPTDGRPKRSREEWRMVAEAAEEEEEEEEDLTPKSTTGRGGRSSPTPTTTTTTRCKRMVISGENGLTLESTAIRHNVFSAATASISINKVVSQESLTLVGVSLRGAGSNWFSTAADGKLPMPCKLNKPRQIRLAFLPDAPRGERRAKLVLRFFDGRQSTTFEVTRKLRGVAKSSKPPSRGREMSGAARRGLKKERQQRASAGDTV